MSAPSEKSGKLRTKNCLLNGVIDQVEKIGNDEEYRIKYICTQCHVFLKCFTIHL